MMSDEEQNEFASEDNRGSPPGRYHPESVPAGTRTSTEENKPDGPAGNDRKTSVSESSSTESRVVGLNAFRPYPVGVGISQPSTDTPAGSASGFDAPSGPASSNSKSPNSDTVAGVVDGRTRKRTVRNEEDAKGPHRTSAFGTNELSPSLSGGSRSHGQRGQCGGRDGETCERGGACNERGMGIRYGNWGSESDSLALNQCAATLETVSGAGRAMWQNHDGGPCDADPNPEQSGENDGPNGYLQEEVKATKPELDVIEHAVDDAYGDSPFHPVGQQILAHVYDCQAQKPWQHHEDGVPIGYRLIKKACREAGLGEVTNTSDVWWPLVEAGYLSYDDYKKGVTTRRFHLAASIMERLRAAARTGYDTKTRYNLVDGSRTYGKQQTRLTYDGQHSWSGKSEFIYKALKALQGQRDLVNTQAVEKHLRRLEVQQGEAWKTYADAAETARKAQDEMLEEGKELTEEGKRRLNQACRPAFETGREYERARRRYDQDLRLWSKIRGQGLKPAEDMPDGICQYETVYQVQMKSGRLTMLVGLQNASEEMKAAACKGIPDYNNVDISSSQTDALIEEMELANQMGADLDVSAVEDVPDKEIVADHFGLGRDAPKIPEHGGKFGAMFNDGTFEEAKDNARGRVFGRITGQDGKMDWSKLHRFEFESGEMAYQRAIYNELPTMARVARDWADNDDCKYDDPEAVYQKLKDFYQEMTEEIDRWRDWLVDRHWEIEGQSGGKGYYVENPCGLPFDKTKYETRYDQKAAYATSRLQGRETAYMLSLAIQADQAGFEYLRNEHDGAAVLGTIPDSARKKAREDSGFHRASLEAKPFKRHENSQDDSSGDSQPQTENNEPCDTKAARIQSKHSRGEKPSRSHAS